MQLYGVLFLLALFCSRTLQQDTGRNDGEPDYNLQEDSLQTRDVGRNDGEPDFQEPNGNTSMELQKRQGSSCTGYPSTNWGCCSSSEPCSVGQGDCDNDGDCAGALVCGFDNCREGINGINYWHKNADCCVATTCKGIPSTDWDCCTECEPCERGEGDCDTDSDCACGLVCGTNNCRPGITGSSWSTIADCCIDPPVSTSGPTNPAFRPPIGPEIEAPAHPVKPQ